MTDEDTATGSTANGRSDEHVELTSDTTFELSSPATVETVHLEDLSFVLDLTIENGEATECVLDLETLIDVMTLYSSMEEHRHGWRR